MTDTEAAIRILRSRETLVLLVPLVAVLVLKLAAYSAWAAYGLRMLSGYQAASPWRALRLGAFRMAIGLTTGGILWLILSHPYFYLHFPTGLMLFVAFAALRWFEWSIVAAVIQIPDRRAVLPRDREDHLFRAGGILVSFATDQLLLAYGSTLWFLRC